MNKRQIKLLEDAWELDIGHALKEYPIPLLQTKSKVAKQLADDGYLELVTLRSKEKLGEIIFEGYRITHAGIFAYCMSLQDELLEPNHG
ncbi:TPA: hypothetical protein ACHQNL_002685 [Serratia marcescens]